MPKVWVARTKSGQHTPEYLAGGYVAVGWVSWEADAKSLTREQLKQKHTEREPDDSPPSVGQKIGQLWAFLHDIQPGDYIINPSANMNELHYGVVEGGPYHDTSERYSDGCLWPHRRRVKWSDETIARQALPDLVKSSVDHGARTLFCVSAGHEFLEWLEKRNAATQVFHETGDTTMAEDIGLFPSQPRRMWEYGGFTFHVVRKSEDSAYVGLKCDDHYHKIFVIGLTESEPRKLLVDRADEGHKYGVGSLEQALEQAGDLIIEECPQGLERRFVKQLDDFFQDVAKAAVDWRREWRPEYDQETYDTYLEDGSRVIYQIDEPFD